MNSVSQALFAKAGRRYGVGNRKTNFKRRKPRDRDGKIKTCRACGSEFHFIRDCDKIRKATLVNLILELGIDDVESLSASEMYDIVQEPPNDVWISISENFDAEPRDSHSVTEAMYVRLSYIADQHDFIKEKAFTGPIVLPSKYGEQQNLTPAFPALLSNIDLNNLDHFKEFIDREVSRIMMNGVCNFKGIMIDNGAAKSPAGLAQFISYCAHTGHVPSISLSSRAFRGMETG